MKPREREPVIPKGSPAPIAGHVSETTVDPRHLSEPRRDQRIRPASPKNHRQKEVVVGSRQAVGCVRQQ